jgi:uncharacterized protein YbjT (DUF2867 family)
MNVILFGATGMVGQGVLRECLLDPGVGRVLAIGRGASGKADPKLRDLVLKDLTDYAAVADELAGYDACFFCLGSRLPAYPRPTTGRSRSTSPWPPPASSWTETRR